MSGPLTTVVIPAYNAEDYLERTMLSAMEQSYRDLEILVVNDGSTDHTEWIARHMAEQDGRIRVINTANGGVAKARNKGLEEAKGEFVAFLDADDLWHPDKIKDQIAALTAPEGRKAAAVYAQMRLIDWEDRVIRNGSGTASSGSVFARHLFARPVGNGSSLLVRRQVALEVGGFDPTWLGRGIGGCEDLDFELKIASNFLVLGLRRFLVGYRSHARSMSVQGLTLARSVVATVEHHLQEHPELTGWAVRKIRGSTLEFALKSMASAGAWPAFAVSLAGLHRTDPLRGMYYTTRTVARKIVPAVHAPIRPASQGGQRPFFYDLSPDQDAEAPRLPRVWDRKLVEHLTELDAQRTSLLTVLE